MIMDKSQIHRPSGNRQAERVKALVDADTEHIEIRILRPAGPCFPLQHSKTWLVDGKAYAGGSANGTHNSLENCTEEMALVREGAFLTAAESYFQELWSISEKITEADLALGAQYTAKRVAGGGRARSASASAERGQ